MKATVNHQSLPPSLEANMSVGHPSSNHKRHRLSADENRMEGAVGAHEEPEDEAHAGMSALSIQHHSNANSEHFSPRSACIETLSPRNQAGRVGDILKNNPGLLWFAIPGAFIWNGGLVIVVSELIQGMTSHVHQPLPVVLILLGLVILLGCVVGGIRMLQVLSLSFPQFLLQSLCILVVAGVGLFTVLMEGFFSGALFGLYYCVVVGLVYWLDVQNSKIKTGFDSL